MKFLRWGRGHDDEALPVEVEHEAPADEAADAQAEGASADAAEAEAPGAVEPAGDAVEPGLAAEAPEQAIEPAAAHEAWATEAVESASPIESAGTVERQAIEPGSPTEPAEAIERESPGEAPDADASEAEAISPSGSAGSSAVSQPSASLGSPEVAPGVVDAVAAELAEADPDVDADDAARLPAADAPARPAVVLPQPDDLPRDDPLGGGRPPALRLAALHLRTGQHALARAELEALAGRGRLDEGALLDLAEVRWRTGDLAGAGEAASVLLARGNESPLALVIAAEATSADGRPGEARRLSARAIELLDAPLDTLFAGMPRSSVWPEMAHPDVPTETPRRRSRSRAGDVEGAPSTASEAFAGGRAALARGDATRAALLLGVALRLAPGFAEDVLRAVSGRDDQPLLALVRGDALRLLGREAEALEAFDRARGRASAAGTSAPPSGGGPGLFDDDPAIGDDEGA